MGNQTVDASRENCKAATDEALAMPHDDVEPKEFYKHIESGLPEPRRMRQLLTWCGTRALIEKPSISSEDSNARLAAREIEQQLLKDFSVKSEMSDWFSRVGVLSYLDNLDTDILAEGIYTSTSNTKAQSQEPHQPQPNSRLGAEDRPV